MTYRAPVNDMLLALNHGAGLQAAVKAGHYGDFALRLCELGAWRRSENLQKAAIGGRL